MPSSVILVTGLLLLNGQATMQTNEVLVGLGNNAMERCEHLAADYKRKMPNETNAVNERYSGYYKPFAICIEGDG